MQCSNRILTILGLVVLVLMAGAIQADPEAHPMVLNFPPVVETQVVGGD